jgi:hypothetical protein
LEDDFDLVKKHGEKHGGELYNTAVYFTVRTEELAGVLPSAVYIPNASESDPSAVCIDYDDAQIYLRANTTTKELLVTASTRRQDIFPLDDVGKNACLFHLMAILRLKPGALAQQREVIRHKLKAEEPTLAAANQPAEVI